VNVNSLGIAREEVLDRQRRAGEMAAARGLDALLVWSRFGTDMYRFGDVTYLTNHHGPVGDFQDAVGWHGHGYNPLILPVEGESVLLVDLPVPDPERIVADQVRFAQRIPDAVADCLRELGLHERRLGLVGQQTLLASSRDAIAERLGRPLALEPADDILETMRMVKSDAEVSLMRNAVRVGCECMTKMMAAVQPGVTQGDIVAEGIAHLVANDGFPTDVAITSGHDSWLYHNPVGPPNWDCTQPLENGEMVHIDLWGPVRRYYTDFARSTVVGGRPSTPQRELLEAPLRALTEILSAVRPGNTIGSLFSTGERWMKENGWLDPALSLADSPPEAGPLFEHVPIFGHGIGMSTEQPWIVANSEVEIVPNMVLAIEFIVSRGSEGAYLEHDVLVTADGFEILDAGCPEQWWE
jgi:Xaa-Pro aminopeptidase